MNFDHFMPVRLITGRGCVKQNPEVLGAMGSRCMIVTSGSAAKKSGALDDMAEALGKAGISFVHYDGVQQNPLVADSFQAGKQAAQYGAQFIVGIGGGSALDAAKAVAVFAANDMADCLDIYDYGKWTKPALPLVAVGTTAGTGSEVAPFSVLTRPDGRKASISHPQIYAKVAFGDAGYTDSLPYGFTVSTALDALSHAIEAYFSTAATALSDLYAEKAVQLLMPELEALAELEGKPIPADMRDRLYYASVVAGFALGWCGTCYPHTLGYFLSEEHGVPHGYACAATLPDFLERGLRTMPQKGAGLLKAANRTGEAIADLIRSITVVPHIALTPGQIDELVSRSKDTKNFQKTGPDGYTAEEARVLLSALYGEER